MKNKHGLPIWNADVENNQSSGIFPSEHAFNGVMKTYDIPVCDHELDLLSFMQSKRDEVEKIVQLKMHSNAQKLQFSAMVQLRKPTSDKNIKSPPDGIENFLN